MRLSYIRLILRKHEHADLPILRLFTLDRDNKLVYVGRLFMFPSKIVTNSRENPHTDFYPQKKIKMFYFTFM